MSIALEALGPALVGMANAAGVSLEAMHRVTALASGSLDVLPHSGAVITLLAVCKLSHRESYGDIFVVCCGAPTVALLAVLLLAGMVGSF
jgi:H+/gluconate symporter-like permease